MPINDGSAIAVPVVPLDAFCAEQQLDERAIRLLKIDVEGYEHIAFEGAGAALGRCHAVLAEYSPSYMKKAGFEPARVLQLLSSRGFAPHIIRNGARVAVDIAELANAERRVDVFWEKTA